MGKTSELGIWKDGGGCKARIILIILHLFLGVRLLSLTISLAIPDGHYRGGAEGNPTISHPRVRVLPLSLLDYLWAMVLPMVLWWHRHKHHTRVVRVVGALTSLGIHLLCLGVVHMLWGRGEWGHVLLGVGPVGKRHGLGCTVRTWVGVDGGVLIVHWHRVMVVAGNTLHSMVVQIGCEIIDMYGLRVGWYLPVPHGGQGDGDAWHEGGGGGRQSCMGGYWN